MNDNETKADPIDRFLQWIVELVRRDDRGALAELRAVEAFALRLENLGLIEPALRESLRDRLRSRYKACPRSMEPPPRKGRIRPGVAL